MSGYLLFKSLHLIAVISWMAGLLYLPRIFVYHVEHFEKEQATEIFDTMKRKLYNYIMMPAMVLSWLFGLILISVIGFDQIANTWLKLKFFLVIILTGYHFFLGNCLNKFKIDENNYSSRFFRIFNEVPTILLILIVFIVILKPI